MRPVYENEFDRNNKLACSCANFLLSRDVDTHFMLFRIGAINEDSR